MPGIIWSRKITSNDLFLRISRHSFPESAVVTLIFVSSRSPAITSRFISLSSTTSMCASGVMKLALYSSLFSCILSRFCAKSPTGVASVTTCFILAVKVVPSPYLLLTLIEPSIMLTRRIVILSPKPVPSIFLFLSSSSL